MLGGNGRRVDGESRCVAGRQLCAQGREACPEDGLQVEKVYDVIWYDMV